MRFSTYLATPLAATLLLLTGCPDKEEQTGTDSATTMNDTGTGGAPTTTAGTDGASSTDGATSSATQDSGMGGTMGGATTGMSTGVDPTGVDPSGTTGGGSGSATPSCEAACDLLFSCPNVPPEYPDKASCVADCTSAVDGSTAECVDAFIGFNECVATYTCAELAAAFNMGDLGKCQAASDAADMVCSGNVCEGFGSVGGPDSCSIGQMCPDMPSEEYSCEADTCTCLVDGVPNGMSCPSNGFCGLDFDAQVQAAFDCCGFEF